MGDGSEHSTLQRAMGCVRACQYANVGAALACGVIVGLPGATSWPVCATAAVSFALFAAGAFDVEKGRRALSDTAGWIQFGALSAAFAGIPFGAAAARRAFSSLADMSAMRLEDWVVLVGGGSLLAVSCANGATYAVFRGTFLRWLNELPTELRSSDDVGTPAATTPEPASWLRVALATLGSASLGALAAALGWVVLTESLDGAVVAILLGVLVGGVMGLVSHAPRQVARRRRRGRPRPL